MPPRVATRTVRLRQPRLTAHMERMQLLTYPMALAQQGATVPLIHSHTNGNDVAAAGQRPPPPPQQPASPLTVKGPERSTDDSLGKNDVPSDDDNAHNRTLPVPRRWVREADELCIASIHRSNNINRINSYVATYKFEDPQWRPLLLPEVHVLPKPPMSVPSNKKAGENVSFFCGNPPTSPTADSGKGFDVFIDYSKLTTLELIARHANYALRHLVQKGHAMYFVNFAQHSIVQMRGLVEASYVTCAYGIRGERLRTHIVHTGPVDVRDIVEIDPHTQRVSFNFKRANVRRGVVALSTVEGYGTWFQRKPMLWQRTRRIGALQSQMGSYDYQLCDPQEVGRLRSYEVSLLAPHVRIIGAQGGAEAVALVASSQVAQNRKLYMGQFEAPVLTAVDAVQQLAHRTALHHQLLRPAIQEMMDTPKGRTEDDAEGEGATTAMYEDPQIQERRRLAGMEHLLPVSWVTRTPPPYVPLEADLPFRIQISRPAVIRADQPPRAGAAAALSFPTSGSVGTPFVKGVPLSLFEYNIHQGVDHYIYDDAPSARPMKWWNQKSNMPYSGYMYAMRSGLLDYVEPAEKIANPLAPPSQLGATATVKSAKHRRKRRMRSVRRSAEGKEEEKERMETSASTSIEKAHHNTEQEGKSRDAHLASMKLNITAEELPAGAENLLGHDDGARQAAALQWVEEGNDATTTDRPPLHTLVAPNTTAQRRLARYATHVPVEAPPSSTKRVHRAADPMGVAPMPLQDRADALLKRQLRLRRLRANKQKVSQAADGAKKVSPVSSNGDAAKL